ncbi:MAG: putative porin [Chthoniobacteraceae bacterium]
MALILGAIPAFGQSAADYQALEKQLQALQARVDKLQQEQADMTVNYSGTAAAATIEQGKVQLSSGVTDLKLFGDLRFRYQYDQFHPVVDLPVQATDDRNRYLFRLRIGADAQLGDDFFAGIVLATGQASDSNSDTYTEGYDNYSIYIDKAFAGWTPTDWLTVILGKQANPFYTTDLVWGPSINPTGAVEVLDLSKALWPDNNRFSLQLISMQGVFENGSSFSTGADTAFQFVEQLKGTYHFNKDTSLTFAPGFMTYTAASLSGLENAQPFTKSNDALTAASGVQTQTTVTNTQTETVKYSATGQPSITLTPVNVTTTVTTTEPATGAVRTVTTETTNNQTQITIPFGAKGNNLKANAKLANETFVTTKTLGGGTTTVTSPVGKEPAEETKDLAIITAPGDFSFKLGSVPTKVFWDFAYNTEGSARATNEYFLTSHSPQDDLAWLAGLQVGRNIHAGDWSAYADYRQVGMDSIDPNINDNYFALSYLNVQGINVGVAYNITDSLVGAITYYKSWQLRQGIVGGEATGGANLANGKSVDVLQMDVNLKF